MELIDLSPLLDPVRSTDQESTVKEQIYHHVLQLQQKKNHDIIFNFIVDVAIHDYLMIDLTTKMYCFWNYNRKEIHETYQRSSCFRQINMMDVLSSLDSTLSYQSSQNYSIICKYCLLNFITDPIPLLDYACMTGNLSIVKKLFTKYPSLNYHTQNDNAMKKACIGGHLDIVIYLHEYSLINNEYGPIYLNSTPSSNCKYTILEKERDVICDDIISVPD